MDAMISSESLTLSRLAAPPTKSAVYIEDWAKTQARLLQDHLEERLAESIAELRERYEQERLLTEVLRRALLLSPTHTQFPGLVVETVTEMAYSEVLIGGDFCDAFPLPTGGTAILVGDVSGKGIVAARRVPEVKFSLRALLSQHRSVARALYCLNDLLCASHDWASDWNEVFATVAVVVLDAKTGRGTCCLAGAEPPLLLRQASEPVHVGRGGMPLGVQAGTIYEEAHFEMDFDDLLLMTTDGITEARRASSFLGERGLIALAMGAWHTDSTHRAQNVARHVIAGARQFAGGALHDDASVLAVERHK